MPGTMNTSITRTVSLRELQWDLLVPKSLAAITLRYLFHWRRNMVTFNILTAVCQGREEGIKEMLQQQSHLVCDWFIYVSFGHRKLPQRTVLELTRPCQKGTSPLTRIVSSMQDRGTCKSQRRNLIPSRARLISSHLISFYFTLLFDENGQSTHLSQGLVLEALFPLCMWTFPYVKALFRRCNSSCTCIATVHIQQMNNEGGTFGSLHFHQECTL